MRQEFRFGPSLTPAVKNLIIINSVIFILDFSLRLLFESDFIIYNFALVPEMIVSRFYIWQICTYQFLHGGISHILFNMLSLWMFGSELEMRWGKKTFYKFYLFSGTMTGAIILVFNLFMGNNIPTVGASGVIFAIMLVYAVYWGDRMVYIWMIIPLKIKYFVIIMGLISFFLMVNPGESNISHIGHLGGFLSGYICLKLFIENLSPSNNFSPSGNSRSLNIFQKIKIYRKKKEWEKQESRNFNKMSDEKKVDEILQKISRKGIKSLSREERKFLKETSEKMNGNNIH